MGQNYRRPQKPWLSGTTYVSRCRWTVLLSFRFFFFFCKRLLSLHGPRRIPMHRTWAAPPLASSLMGRACRATALPLERGDSVGTPRPPVRKIRGGSKFKKRSKTVRHLYSLPLLPAVQHQGGTDTRHPLTPPLSHLLHSFFYSTCWTHSHTSCARSVLTSCILSFLVSADGIVASTTTSRHPSFLVLSSKVRAE